MQPSLLSAIMKLLSPIDLPFLAGIKEVVVVNPFGRRRILGGINKDSEDLIRLKQVDLSRSCTMQ